MEPVWIKQLLKTFLNSVTWTDIKSDIEQIFSYKYIENEDDLNIIISPWVHEIYGGKNDGLIKSPCYEVNLINIINFFDNIDFIGFDSQYLEINMSGVIQNKKINLAIKKQSKQNCHKKVDAYTGKIIKISSRIG